MENGEIVSRYGDLSARISSVRAQVCPRTAYATAGSSARQLNVISIGDNDSSSDGGEVMDEELTEAIVATGEFETCKLQTYEDGDMSSVVAGGVYLIHCREDGVNGKVLKALKLAQKFITGSQVPLVFIFAEAYDSDAGAAFSEASVKAEGVASVYNKFDSRLHLLSCYASSAGTQAVTSSSDKRTRNAADRWGSQGQPAVGSRDQFRYLWSRAYTLGAEVGMMDCGKQRVLQRLADKVDGNGQKWTAAEWDTFVSDSLKGGADDFGVYSMIRKKITGRTLEEDLVVKLDGVDAGAGIEERAGAGAGAVAAEKSGAEDEDGDGRAAFMVKMTLECLPDDLKGQIGSILDYGCAEGAITAELGKQLHLPASRVYGADVRSIPSEGFTFIQLQEESPNKPPEVGELLPRVKDNSIMFVTSAMVMHHVRYPLVAMKELRRVMHPRGVLVMREHHCDSAEMAAFLDITHGLYSLAWSVPLEWPKFLEEYTAWYRSQEDWDQLMTSAGFNRITGHFRIDRHYNAAKQSKLRERDGRVTNVIKAYYAAYSPDPTYQGEARTGTSSSSAASMITTTSKVSGTGPSTRVASVNSIWGGTVGTSTGKEDSEVAGGASVEASDDVSTSTKRARGESSEEEKEPVKKRRGAMESVLEAVGASSSSTLDISSNEIDVFESRSNRGHFYVPLKGGQALWVSMFYMSELGDSAREAALPVHPEKSLIPSEDHPVDPQSNQVAFLDDRHKRVMRIRKIIYAKK